MSSLRRIKCSPANRGRSLYNRVLLEECKLPKEIAWPGNLATPGDENSPLQRHRTFNNLRVFSEEPNPISEHPPVPAAGDSDWLCSAAAVPLRNPTLL
jgi:hypothetical protein